MRRPRVQTSPRKRQLQQAKERNFLLGVQCGARVSKMLIKSGWIDMGKLEAEVLDRVRGR
jgi:hypothetical protein